MATHPSIQLSRLRQIGWENWNPIGLGNDDGTWSEDCADEYDRYLLHVASLMCNDSPVSEGGDYLVHIASKHMGLSHVDAAAAAETSEAIANCLASLPDGPVVIR
jgi:hypothetical protein